eukprot:7463346-Pyramimonas_sp.AAC.1
MSCGGKEGDWTRGTLTFANISRPTVSGLKRTALHRPIRRPLSDPTVVAKRGCELDAVLHPVIVDRVMLPPSSRGWMLGFV